MARDMQINEKAEQLFGEMKEIFREWENTGSTAFQKLAIKYKQFMEAEGDRSVLESVFPWNVIDALQLIAENRLIPDAVRAILTNARLAKCLAMLDLEQQQRLCNEGMEIIRHGRVQFVPLHHVTLGEFKRAISIEGGQVRLRSGSEQIKLFHNKPVKDTAKWQLNVPRELKTAVAAIAAEENQTEEEWIIKLVRKEIAKRKNGASDTRTRIAKTRSRREVHVN